MGSYLRPNTLDAALAALSAGPRAVLAGGTDHYPARAADAPEEDILDISALPGLRAIAAHGDHWWLPCQATWSDLIAADLPGAFDALRQAARQVGGAQVQNAGTIVGNLCNASPAADGVPCLLALDAVVRLASRGGAREVGVADFLLAPRRTARRPDELVLGLKVPRHDRPVRSAFLKLGARRYLVISIAMVGAAIECAPDGAIAAARIAVGACGPVATRLPALEAALRGHRPDPALVRPEHLAALAPIDDIRAPAAYRRAAALELARRAVAALAQPGRAAG
ncbi:MAG: FAD binding domain-containing protein [Rhodospirillales bacterium]|nr:FAD binding domain-containing protein [Rhodospirillales bacterium]